MLQFEKLRNDLLPLGKEINSGLKFDKEQVLRILDGDDPSRIREVSDYFYRVSGIYKRIIWLFTGMFNFDNIVIPHSLSKGVSSVQLAKSFQKALLFIDSLVLKQLLREITFYVFKDGTYYGYLRTEFDKPTIQQLPFNYCRSKYKVDGRYAVEFNLRYFDSEYYRTEDRKAALKSFPKEIRKFYRKYKLGTLNPDKAEKEWVVLSTDYAFAFRFPDKRPFFTGAIVDLIELKEYKNLELEKDKLALFLLLVQKMPMTKDGEMVFDVGEARDLHKNALKMLEKNPNVDVLTTFAEMQMIDLQEHRQTIKDNLQKAERAVYNETGVSRMIFATEGNLSLKQAVKGYESIVRYLTELYSTWLSHIINLDHSGNKHFFEVWVLPTTIFNEEEMEKKYRGLATLGYSKFLPGIVGGLKQSSMLNLIDFENNVLKLGDSMEPLQSTHTISKDDDGGRPKKEEDDRSSGTVENLEGQG